MAGAQPRGRLARMTAAGVLAAAVVLTGGAAASAATGTTQAGATTEAAPAHCWRDYHGFWWCDGVFIGADLDVGLVIG